MPYKIKQYSYNKAKKLGVEIKPSTNPLKKIDVFKNGEKIASIGALGYNDYPTYLEQDKTIANQKRIAYKARHQGDRLIKGSNGWWSDNILW